MPGDGDLRGPGRFLWWLMVSQRWRVALAAMLGTLWMVGLVLPPYVLSLAIDDGLQHRRFSSLAGWVLVLLALGVVNACIAIMRHRTLTKVRMDAAFRTLNAVVEQSVRLGGALAGQVSAGEAATIGIGDIWVISTSLTVVGPGVGGAVAYVVVAVLLLSVSPLLTLVVLLGAPAIAVTVGPPLGRLRRAGSVYRDRRGELTSDLVDIAAGLPVLNGIGGKDLFAARYRRKSRELRDEGYRVGSISSWIPSLGGGLPLIFLAIITWLGARMAAAGTISIGDLVAVYGYVSVLVIPVAELIESGSNLAQAAVSARRVIPVLRLRRDRADAPGTAPGDGPQAPADLHDPESGCLVPAGRLTALASARPGDAQLVIDRMGRFTPSAAVWGGIGVGSVAPQRFRERVLVADNEADIFAGTLRAVVAGRFDPDEQAIARALLAAEPTSAVDAHTEAVIADRLCDARSGRTTLVTTTSPLLLDRADIVHYLVNGRVAATGTHRELLDSQPGYRRLVSRGLEIP
jgi:ABC-type multidrug transport system fused ATPase/permease subunit